MARPRKYPPELLDRGARLVFESNRPIAHVARDLGVPSETLRKYVRQLEADEGRRPDLPSSEEREEIKALRKEVYDLRRANEDTTDCPPRRFAGARAGGAGASSAGRTVVGAVGLFASAWRAASAARAAGWQPFAGSGGVD